MSISGNGREYDISFLIGDKVATTTSQYKVVGFVPGTTTSADRTVDLCGQTGTNADATAASSFAIGINQTYLSSTADTASIRLFGVSKAYCAHSIGAGSFVAAYNGISTTTMNGRIMQLVDGATMGTADLTATAQFVILGRALENGSTGTVISVFLNPQFYDRQLVGSLTVT